jgi:hypothetical protein
MLFAAAQADALIAALLVLVVAGLYSKGFGQWRYWFISWAGVLVVAGLLLLSLFRALQMSRAGKRYRSSCK